MCFELAVGRATLRTISLRERVELQFRYLLVARFALCNLVAIGLCLAAYLQGWLDGILTAHLRELSLLIFLVFVYGLVLCAGKLWQNSSDLNDIKVGTPNENSQAGKYLRHVEAAGSESRAIQAGALRLRLTERIVIVRHIANALIFLGLIGTVIGFIVALSGVDPAAASEVENVKAMVSTLINGMSVALYTTLVGAVFYVWLIINYRLLVTGTVDLISTTLELGEQRAGS